MTLQLIDGFDHMGTVAKFSSKGWNVTAGTGAGQSQSVVGGRIAGNALSWSTTTNSGGGSGNDNYFKKSLPSALTQFVAGFALNITQLPAAGVGMQVFELWAGATKTVQVRITDSGLVRVQNSSGGSVTGTTVITTGTWNYIELKVVINGASGSVSTQVNGGADLGTNTVNFGSTGIDAVYLFLVPSEGSASARTHNWDDVYVLNTVSSPNNDFLGDVHVETLYPSADGAHSAWVPNSGTVHYDRVTEHTGTYPDNDTTYVSSLTVNNIDSYAYSDLSIGTGTVFGVQTNLYARKDEVAARNLQPLVRRSATDYLSGVDMVLSTGYVDSTFIWETDPSTSSAWGVSGVNAAEFGVKVTV